MIAINCNILKSVVCNQLYNKQFISNSHTKLKKFYSLKNKKLVNLTQKKREKNVM
jgi:hypothetical protein